MKTLILVLSYNEPPYRELMQAQQATFDSIEVEGITTVYYHGGSIGGVSGVQTKGRTFIWLGFPCTDSYYYMAEKFKMCLDYVKDWDYDIIFRTNSSSYVNKQRLKEFAATLPIEKLYAGWEIHGNAGYNVCSGAGFFLSRDTAAILRDKIDPTFEREEDVYCGQLLHDAGIKIINDQSRLDYPQQQWKDLKKPYHIRFKTDDRIKDAENMKIVHQKIIG